MSFAYRGAEAMIELEHRYLMEFVEVWREAKARGLELPPTEDPDYASLEALLHHVLRASRSYLTWICESLDLHDPEVDPAPEVGAVAEKTDAYVAHLHKRWLRPLRHIPEERFGEVYESRWGVDYCIDAMMEHAVMHPIRHTFQLRNLLR
jgi:hypothetical protein